MRALAEGSGQDDVRGGLLTLKTDLVRSVDEVRALAEEAARIPASMPHEVQGGAAEAQFRISNRGSKFCKNKRRVFGLNPSRVRVLRVTLPVITRKK